MTKFYAFWRTRTAIANFWYLVKELKAVGAYLARASFQADRRSEQIYRVATFEGKISIYFLPDVVPAVAVVFAKTP